MFTADTKRRIDSCRDIFRNSFLTFCDRWIPTLILNELDEHRRIVAELDAEAAQIETDRALFPRYDARIQRVLDFVWGTGS